MQNKIYLSSGSFPWLGITEVAKIAKTCGFNGIELLPTRAMNNTVVQNTKTAHQSWRLDIGHDTSYGIPFITSILYTLIRYTFFPDIKTSQKLLTDLSRTYHIPITVHHLSKKWTHGSDNKEFSGGLHLEILDDKSITKKKLKTWLQNSKHGIVADTRDDQSLRWARYNRFLNFKDFWTWIGLKKIKAVQLSLIGKNGMRNILSHKETLAEKELLWLHTKKWHGPIVVEINPLFLFFYSRGNSIRSLRIIVSFIKTSLHIGRRWSSRNDEKVCSVGI